MTITCDDESINKGLDADHLMVFVQIKRRRARDELIAGAGGYGPVNAIQCNRRGMSTGEH